MCTLTGHSCEVTSVAFSENGKRVVSGGDDLVKIWDTATGAEVSTFLVCDECGGFICLFFGGG